MKKLIFLFLITMVSFQVNANVVKETLDSTIKATNEVLTTIDTNAVSKQLYTDVKAGIAGLATGLKVSAEHVWDIIVRQQLVYSICISFCIIITIFSWFHFYYRIKIGIENKWGNPGMGDLTSYHFLAIVTFLLAISGTCVSTINFNTMVTGYINPEYGAIQTIIEVVKH